MRKILVICGPTSTGKTSLAINLAKKFNGELISADSRQVYELMDIGTGKDLPDGSVWRESKILINGIKEAIGYWKVEDSVKIWGYDLVLPDEDFSVALYVSFASKIIEDIFKRGKLPILVGGTGLYIKAVIDGIPTISIPKSKSLRKYLYSKSAGELFESLAKIDPVKAASLNISDRKNPRRLIRAIEVAQSNNKNNLDVSKLKYDSVFFVGLKASIDKIGKIIECRVERRLKRGVKDEVRKLMLMGLEWDSQALNTLGYREWEDFFKGAKTESEVVNAWKKDERNYFKRQTTWFKKDNRIKWFDVSSEKWRNDVEKSVDKWYKIS